jgi:hypothetical protein
MCPYDYIWVGNTLVVAGLDPRKDNHRTEITTYHKRDLVPCYNRAARYAKENEDDDLIGKDGQLDSECYYETAPADEVSED